MNLKDFRTQYPQYNDLSDQELATGLHKKFYSDIPFGEFAKQIGIARGAEDVGIIEGAGTALKRGFESFGDIGTGYSLAGSALFGTEADTRAKMQAYKQQQEKEAQEAAKAPMMTVADFERIAAEKGVLAAAKEAPKYILEQLGLSGPQMAGPLAVGAATSAVAGPVIGAVAGIGTYGLQQFGNFLARQAVEKEDPKELSVLDAAIAAGGTAPIGYFADKFTVGLGSVGKNAGKEAIKELTARQVALQTGKKAVGGATVGIIAEAPTEVLESVAERWQAGLDLTSKDAYDEYKESFFGAAAIGGGIGGTAAGYRGYKEATAKPEQPPSPVTPPVTPPAAPDVFQMTPVDRARELAGLLQGEQTPETQARIDELRAADVQQVEQDLARIKGTEPKTLEEQIKTQVPTQMAIREAGIEEAGYLPGMEFAGPVPEAQFPTTLTSDVLDKTGLSKRSSFYKELEGKSLTDPKDQAAIGEILRRVRSNPNIAESTKTGLESIAMQGFGAAAQQGELFGKRRVKGELPVTAEAARTGPAEAAQAELFPETAARPLTEEDLKGMGIGPTNKAIREQLLGKDLNDPEQAQTVKEVLDAFGSDPKRSPKVAKGVEDFLTKMGWRKADERAGKTVPGAAEPSVPVSKQRRAKPAGRAVPSDLTGVAPAGTDVEPTDVGEAAEPSALSPEERAIQTARSLGASAVVGERITKANPYPAGSMLAKAWETGTVDAGAKPVAAPETEAEPAPREEWKTFEQPTGEEVYTGRKRRPSLAEKARTEYITDQERQTLQEANQALNQYLKQAGSVDAALDYMASEIANETKVNRVNKAAQKGLTNEQAEQLERKVRQAKAQRRSAEKATKRVLRYREARSGEKGNPKGIVDKYVRKLMEDWVNAPKTEVVQSIAELPDYMQAEIREAKVNPKGAFDPRTETVYIVADNITGKDDLILTVTHEAIGHYGLRAVLGGTYSKVLNNLYNTNDQVKAKANIKIKRDGLDRETAIEEVLAEAVEEKIPAGSMMGRALQTLKNVLRAAMRAFGVKTLNDREVQDLLDSFAGYVIEGKGTRGEGVAGPQAGVFSGKDLEIMKSDAAWSPTRIDDLLDSWAYLQNDNDTKAYAGFVNPKEFLSASSPDSYREEVLEKENRPLSEDELAKYDQPIFLQVELDKLQTGRGLIIGHEGRHRMMALRDAGITKVPVLFINGYAGQRISDAKPIKSVKLTPRPTEGEVGFTATDLIPVSYAYKEEVKQTFGKPSAQVVFRRGAQPTLTAEGLRAEAAVNAMGNISNAKPKVPEKSTIAKVGAFFFDTAYRQDQIDRFRTQVTYKGASVERKLMDAFNGKVRDALGNIRPDLFMTAAEHSDTMTVAAMKQGTLYLNKDIGWDVKQGPNTLQGSMDTVRQLGEKLGSQELAFKLANDAFIARRANALKNHPDKDVFALPSQDKIDAGLQAFKDFPELEKAFQEYTGFKNGLIDAMVEGGRLSKEQAQTWKDAIDYVPWNRIKEYEETAQTSPKGYFRGLVNLGQMGKLTGSEDAINNVFDNMVGLSFWMTNSAIRNHAALNLVDTFSNLNLGVRQVREGQSGVDPNKVIYIYRDGKPESYEFDSIADVYAFKGVESLSMPVLKSLASFANFLRKATTATPQFAVSQLFQDSYRAIVASGTKQPFRTAAGVLTGFKDAYFGDPTTQRLEQLGIVGMYDLMPGRVKEDIEKEFGLKQRSKMEKAVNFMESFSIASDAALRKSVFERTLAETKSEQFPEGDMLLARYRAQEIINFKRQGANRLVGLFRQIVPFMNAYIQGMDVFYRSMTGRGIAADERAAATKLFWATGAKLAALSALYAFMVGDDDEYKGLRDFEKDKNFIIPGAGLKIPVAPEVGFLFKVLPERAWNYISSQGTESPQDATALRKAIATAGFDAITGPNLTPQFVKPLVEASLNFSFFTNTPIVGRGLEQRESSQQFTSTTSELAKMFGELTGMSPMKLEYVFRGYTGIAGGTLLDLTNMMFTNRPDRHVYELPGFKTFMYDKIPGGYKEQYYDLRDRVTEVNATINGMIADGRSDELMPYLTDEKLNKYALVQTINEIDQTMEDFRAMRKLVSNDKSMSGEEKRRIVDEIEQTENELLKFYNIPAMRKKIAGL